MSKTKRHEQRKEQILKAAERIFAQKGFYQATVSEIAREAGVSDATIYEYFPTKEEILFTIPLEATRQGQQSMAEHLGFIRGAANKLWALAAGYLRFYQQHPDYAAVALLTLKANREFLKTDAYQCIRHWSRQVVDVVKDGIRSGEFKPNTDPYLLRAIILGAIEHSVISWLLLGRPDDLAALADPLIDTVVQGIGCGTISAGWNLKISLDPPPSAAPVAGKVPAAPHNEH